MDDRAVFWSVNDLSLDLGGKLSWQSAEGPGFGPRLLKTLGILAYAMFVIPQLSGRNRDKKESPRHRIVTGGQLGEY